MSVENLGQTLVKLKLRLSRGQSWLTYIQGLLLISAWLKVFNFSIEFIVIITPMIFFLIYSLGWMDERIGIWKRETVYSVRELNPFYNNLDKKIDNILEKVKKL